MRQANSTTCVHITTFWALQEDPKYAAGMKIRSPESRLRYFVGLCNSKRMDEATGNPQPAYKYLVRSCGACVQHRAAYPSVVRHGRTLQHATESAGAQVACNGQHSYWELVDRPMPPGQHGMLLGGSAQTCTHIELAARNTPQSNVHACGLHLNHCIHRT